MASTTMLVVTLLWIPITEEQSGYTIVGFKEYTYETVYPFSSASSNFTFRGVLFDFAAPVSCPQNTGGGNLCALVTQSNGVTYWFNVSFPPPCRSSLGSWDTWVSPNKEEAVEIRDCYSTMPFHLLVAA
ncbi:MAG: hypothetical protein L3K02_00365 [Thermoplasmata archaeon]|nr:hypothetical protein [Thermoplasmata archaeon]